MNFVRFFLGTPRRFLATTVAVAIIFGLFNPELVGLAVSNLLSTLLQAVKPFVSPLLTLAIMVIGVVWAFRMATRRRGGGR